MRMKSMTGAAAALIAVVGPALAQPPGITMEQINTTLPLEGAPLAVPGPYQVTSGPAFGSPGLMVFHPANLDAFLKGTRVLVCLLPLTAATRGLLSSRVFDALPRGAYVVNVARGAILDEPALLASIERGHLAGAALDVFAEEPLPPTSPLWRDARIYVTPHVAA